jgi:hypothetical protein
MNELKVKVAGGFTSLQNGAHSVAVDDVNELSVAGIQTREGGHPLEIRASRIQTFSIK